MSQYQQLDAMILKAITAGRHPLYYGPCETEATRIAEATGRKSFRVLDGRLQALRKAGQIQYLDGWTLVTAQEATRLAANHCIAKRL